LTTFSGPSNSNPHLSPEALASRPTFTRSRDMSLRPQLILQAAPILFPFFLTLPLSHLFFSFLQPALPISPLSFINNGSLAVTAPLPSLAPMSMDSPSITQNRVLPDRSSEIPTHHFSTPALPQSSRLHSYTASSVLHSLSADYPIHWLPITANPVLLKRRNTSVKIEEF